MSILNYFLYIISESKMRKIIIGPSLYFNPYELFNLFILKVDILIKYPRGKIKSFKVLL